MIRVMLGISGQPRLCRFFFEILWHLVVEGFWLLAKVEVVLLAMENLEVCAVRKKRLLVV